MLRDTRTTKFFCLTMHAFLHTSTMALSEVIMAAGSYR